MHVKLGGWAWLDRRALTPVQIRKLQKMLTVKPRKMHPKADDPKPIRLFHLTKNRLGVPREFFLRNARQHHDIELMVTEGRKDLWAGPIEFNPAFSLRDDQPDAFNQVIRRLRYDLSQGCPPRMGGIVKAATGWGKSVLACAVIAELQVPTLVVVNKEPLFKQWREELETFLPGVLVGEIQGDTCDFKGKHVVMGMIHSLSQRMDYPEELYQWPGLVITDEVHRIAAPTWSEVPGRFSARYRLGLSATPKRKDGTAMVFRAHMGELLYSGDKPLLDFKVKRVWTNFHVVKSNRFNPELATEGMLLRFMQANTARNKLITRQLFRALQSGRQVLLLSKRKKHLETLIAMCKVAAEADPLTPVRIAHLVGGASDEELKRAKKDANIIFATSQYVSEGFNIPRLDTLFLTMPMGDIVQAVGRILRLDDNKKEPIVVDFRDDKVEMFERSGVRRDRQYSQLQRSRAA